MLEGTYPQLEFDDAAKEWANEEISIVDGFLSSYTKTLVFSGSQSNLTVRSPIQRNYLFNSYIDIHDIKNWCENVKHSYYLTYSLKDCWSLYHDGVKIEHLEIPEGTSCINKYAFAGCDSLLSVTIPSTVSSIDGKAFYKCVGLEKIYVSPGNQWYESENGEFLKRKDGKAILRCLDKSICEYEVPEGTERLEAQAFAGCHNLSSITLPASLSSIGNFALSGTSISTLTIPRNVNRVGSMLFGTTERDKNNYWPISVFFDGMYSSEINEWNKTVLKWIHDLYHKDDEFVNNEEHLTNATLEYSFGWPVIEDTSSLDSKRLLTLVGLNDMLCSCAFSENSTMETTIVPEEDLISDYYLVDGHYQYPQTVHNLTLEEISSISGANKIDELIIPKYYRLPRSDKDDYYHQSIYYLKDHGYATIDFYEVNSPIIRLGDHIFDDVKKIHKLIVPTTISSISERARKKVDIVSYDPGKNAIYKEDGAIYDSSMTTLLLVKKEATSISIPATVSSIADGAFIDVEDLSANVSNGNPFIYSSNHTIYNKTTDKAMCIVPYGDKKWAFPINDISKVDKDTFKCCYPPYIYVNQKLTNANDFPVNMFTDTPAGTMFFMFANTYKEIKSLRNYPWGNFRNRTYMSLNNGTGVIIILK